MPVVALLGWTNVTALQPPQARPQIEIQRPEQPTNPIARYEASCGPHRYGLVLHYRHADPTRRLHAITVGGVEIDQSEREHVLQRLSSTTSIMEAKIDQCSGADTHRARVRLLVTERPAPGVQFRFLDFWVAPDGTISRVRFN